MDTPTFQILIMIVNSAGVLILALIGIIARGFMRQYNEDKVTATNRLNAHSFKIDATSKEVSDIRLLYIELRGEISKNDQRDEARMELIKSYVKNTNDGLGRIEHQQTEDAKEIKTIDRRLTDYIIKSK